jgi:hypothetical protein
MLDRKKSYIGTAARIRISHPHTAPTLLNCMPFPQSTISSTCAAPPPFGPPNTVGWQDICTSCASREVSRDFCDIRHTKSRRLCSARTAAMSELAGFVSLTEASILQTHEAVGGRAAGSGNMISVRFARQIDIFRPDLDVRSGVCELAA